MTSDPPPPRVLLFHTLGCHLCEVAQALVIPLATQRGWHCELIEISADEALLARYGVRIPVLRVARTGRELDWPFEADAVLDLLR